MGDKNLDCPKAYSLVNFTLKIMKKIQRVLAVLFLTFICHFNSKGQKKDSSLKKGKILFETQCGACHGISNGNFGPKLGGVHATRPLEELSTRLAKSRRRCSF
jgi:mono/diheme cytochrome c family protein